MQKENDKAVMSGIKLNDQIRQELLEIIKTNKHIKEYKLPSERMLSIKFNASRPSVRSAYQKLIKQGYVEVVHGKGYFIKNNLSSAREKSPIKLHFLFIAPSLKTALFPLAQAFRLVALKRQSKQLAELKTLNSF